jgi:hypothetical protein
MRRVRWRVAIRLVVVWSVLEGLGPGGASAAQAGAGGQVGDSCPPGFSGSDCQFCTWTSAGAACQPGSPRDLVDLPAIKAMTLQDLGWTPTDTRSADGVTVVLGDWAGGVLQTYDPAGNPVDVPLREAAALYVPDGYPATANPNLGLVYAAHYPENLGSVVAANIARRFGMPVLYHGEYPNWRQAGYLDRKSINQATGLNLRRANPCQPTDFVRGNFPLTLAHTDMLAITLLQRLAAARGGAVQRVALRGFSKEGEGAWLAFLIDERIEVGIPGGAHSEDSVATGLFREAVYGCAPGTPHQEDIQSGVNGREWRLNTPAGAASMNLLSISTNVHLLHPRVLLIDGDVGMYNMHDGFNGEPAGDETGFLDSFAVRPWRYVRKATVEPGADGEDGDVTSTTAVPMLGAELLVAGPGSEATLYPNILETSAVLDGDSFVVTATSTAIAEVARVWWTWSEDMVFDDVEQEPWKSVAMTASGAATWTSPPIPVPPGTVIGWYAEVGNSITIGGREYRRNHAAPIRFLRATAAQHCEPVPITGCFPAPLRVRRHLRPAS